MKIFKKMISLLLSLILAVSVIAPIQIFADEGASEAESTIVPALENDRTGTIMLQHGRLPIYNATRNDVFFEQIGAPSATTLPLYAGTPFGVANYTGAIDVGSISRRAAPQPGGLMHATPAGASLNANNGNAAWLMYFDLDILNALIPELSDPNMNVEIDGVTLYLHNIQANAGANLNVHRVIDQYNMGTSLASPGWVPGTHAAGNHGANPAVMNNGVSWSFRNNGFTAVTTGPPVEPPLQEVLDSRVGWTNVPGSTLGDSIASTPSATLQVPVGMAGSTWVAITGPGMANDVEAWLANPSSNQGWMFDFAAGAGPFNVRSSRDTVQNGIARPALAIRYSVTEIGGSMSDDATLATLTVSGTNALPGAAPSGSFTHNVLNTVDSVTVVATPYHAEANVTSIVATGATTVSGNTVSNLPVGNTTITITVTAENGATTRVYTIVVNRAAPGGIPADAITVALQQGRIPVTNAERNDGAWNTVGPGFAANPLYTGTNLGSTPFTGTVDVGAMSRTGAHLMQANPGGPVLTNFNGNTAWLMYFDVAQLNALIPEFGNPSSNITIHEVALYLHNNNANAVANFSLHRVLDPDNMGSWVQWPGTDNINRHGNAVTHATAPPAMNDGVSWLFRHNGFASVTLAPPVDPVPPEVLANRVGWTNTPGSTIADSVASAPSAVANFNSRGNNSWSRISGPGMADDVYAWLTDPASNQGWFFAFAPPASGQFNARSSRTGDGANVTPLLVITYTVTDGPPVTTISLNEPVAQQDGFNLSWVTSFENNDSITRYVIEWSGGGESGTVEVTGTSHNLRSHHFTYGVDIDITVRGYDGTDLIATSNQRTATIVDNRTTTDGLNSFTHTWSAVHGAIEYRLEFGTTADFTNWNASDYVLVSAPSVSGSVTGLSSGTWHYRVIAIGAGDVVLRTGSVRSIAVDGPTVDLTTLTPGEDRFTLVWTHQGMDTFSVVYTIDGGSEVTVLSAVSPLEVSSADFDYGAQVEFWVRGYVGSTFAGISNNMTSQILDRRATRGFHDGFTYTWSAVYGAQLYQIRYWLAGDEANARTATTTGTSITRRDSAVFSTGQLWHFEVLAFSTPTVDAGAVLRTLSGMTITIPEERPPVDLEPQTIELRHGVDGYAGTMHVGFIIPNNANMMGASMSPGIMLGDNDGRGLLFFDLEDIFPAGTDLENIFVTNAMLSMFQSFNVNIGRDVQLHRVLDPDNLGMWVPGTNAVTAWGITSRNNGASWFNRDNGINVPGHNNAPDRTPIPWTADGGNLGSSVASMASAVTHVPNRSPFANNRVDFSTSIMAQDINEWIQNPESNQGWMFSRIIHPGIPDATGPHFWGSAREPITQRPLLTITFLDLSDLGDDAVIFVNDVVAEQDGFFLQWFPFGDIDSFVVEYEVGGVSRTINTTETSIWIRSHEFVYDTDFSFTILGYYNNSRVAESYPTVGRIVDNRSFTAHETGIDLSWSRVYGAESYIVDVRRASNHSDVVSETVTTGTSVEIRNPAFFTFGDYYKRVRAMGELGVELRDSGWIPFGRPDVTPPVTTISVAGAYAYTPTDAMLLPPNRGPVTVTVVSATDLNAHGIAESGVARTEFRFNNDFQNTFQVNNPGLATNTQNDAPGNEWVMDPWHPVSVGGTITVNAQGVTRVWVRSIDYAGNVEMPQPIYIVIDHSDLLVYNPVITSGGSPRARLVAGETISISMDAYNRHDSIGLDAFMMVALFDASGVMRNVVESAPVSIPAQSQGTITTSMTLPGNVAAGWYLDVLLLETGSFNPLHTPHVFPHQRNMHQHTLSWRPMPNSLVVNAALPIITQQPRGLMIVNSEVEPGETFELTVYAESIDDGNLTYQWYMSVNGGPFAPITDATGATHIVEFDDIADLFDNDTFEFYVRVTNSRAGAVPASIYSHAVMVSIVDEITHLDVGYRVVLAGTFATDIDIMLGDHDDAKLVAFTNNWFRDQNGIWRDATGFALTDIEAEALVIHRYIMHPRYAVPTMGLSLVDVAARSAGNYSVYINLRGLHAEVTVSSAEPDGSVHFFTVETLEMTLNEVNPADRAVMPIFPGDRTEMTPIGEAAAIAYALAGDRATLSLYGESGNFLDSFELELLATGTPIFLVTYSNTTGGNITVYTMTGPDRDNLTPTTISADTIVRVRYNDGTFVSGQRLMQYGYLVRDTADNTRWVLAGLVVDVEYLSLAGNAQGYITEFIPYIPSAYFEVTIVIEPAGAGTITGLATGGIYQRGETATLTAVASPLFRFVGWFNENGELISANPILSFEVNYDIEIEARFTDDDGIRSFFLQNGRPWQPFNDTDLYGGNITRNGIFDGAMGGSPTGSANPSTDLFIWNRDPAGSNFGQWVQQSLIHFELDGYLPQGVEGVDFVIEEARLHLAHNRTGPQGGTADLDVYRLLDPNETGMWDRAGAQGAVSWRYKSQAGGGTQWYAGVGGSIDNVRELSYTIQNINMENDTLSWLIADVTADVAAWARGDLYNMGWLLRQNNAVASATPGLANNPGAIVISNSSNTAGWAPMLEIVYRILHDQPDTQTISGSFAVITPHLNVRVSLMDGTTEVDYQYVNAQTGAVVDFEFTDVAPGVYGLVFTRPGHTSFTVYNVVVINGEDFDFADVPQFPAVLPLWPGDMNGDGIIDIADLQLFTALMHTNDPSADINGDGLVNAFDRNLLMAHMGRESEYITLP